MFTDIQNKILNEKTDHVELMAKSLWDTNQIADYDPMHPQWEHLEDPIKDDYRLAASLAVLANNGESVSFDGGENSGRKLVSVFSSAETCPEAYLSQTLKELHEAVTAGNVGWYWNSPLEAEVLNALGLPQRISS